MWILAPQRHRSSVAYVSTQHTAPAGDLSTGRRRQPGELQWRAAGKAVTGKCRRIGGRSPFIESVSKAPVKAFVATVASSEQGDSHVALIEFRSSRSGRHCRKSSEFVADVTGQWARGEIASPARPSAWRAAELQPRRDGDRGAAIRD